MAWAVEHLYAIAFVKRSLHKITNWALASDHSRAGMVHSFSDLFKTKNSNFIAASSVGKWPARLGVADYPAHSFGCLAQRPVNEMAIREGPAGFSRAP
jgi:hypothetical protein